MTLGYVLKEGITESAEAYFEKLAGLCKDRDGVYAEASKLQDIASKAKKVGDGDTRSWLEEKVKEEQKGLVEKLKGPSPNVTVLVFLASTFRRGLALGKSKVLTVSSVISQTSGRPPVLLISRVWSTTVSASWVLAMTSGSTTISGGSLVTVSEIGTTTSGVTGSLLLTHRAAS